jgi:hypothetical protein
MDSQHRLAKTLAPGSQATPLPTIPNLALGRGTIVTTPGGGKVTMTLDGGTTVITADRLAGCGTLSAGMFVECLIFGTRIIVLGPFSG